MLFGILARSLYAAKIWPFLLAGDAQAYMGDAVRLLSGESFTPYWPPGLSLILSPAVAIGGNSPVAAVVTMLLLYIAFAFLLDHVGRKLASGSVVNLLQLVFALMPAWIHHSVTPLTQLPVAVLMLGIVALWFAYKDKNNTWYLALTGLLLGMMILVRPASLLLLPAIPFLLYFQYRRKAAIWIPLAAGLILITGWQLKAWQMSEQRFFINASNSRNFFLGNNPFTPLYKSWWLGSHEGPLNADRQAYGRLLEAIHDRPDSETDQAYRAEAIRHIQARPDLFLIRTAARVRCFFAFDTFTGAAVIRDFGMSPGFGYFLIAMDAVLYLLLLAGAVVALFLDTHMKRLQKLILLIFAAYALPYFLAFSHPTYHFPLLPLLGLLALGLSGKPMDDRLKELRSLSKQKKTVLILTAIALLAIQIEWIIRMR
jgi:4-amino-4-deoxy-L-arabinose transferase-like glycosyltransferase